MDYVIFNQTTKEFLRFQGREIFVTSDEEELENILDKEKVENPITFVLTYRKEEDNQICVSVWKGNTKIGEFMYTPDFDGFNFYNELENWTKRYILSL